MYNYMGVVPCLGNEGHVEIGEDEGAVVEVVEIGEEEVVEGEDGGNEEDQIVINHEEDEEPIE